MHLSEQFIVYLIDFIKIILLIFSENSEYNILISIYFKTFLISAVKG